MDYVRPKKHLGQHFLTDLSIAERIAESISTNPEYILEVGPGKGVLTNFIKKHHTADFKVIEIDRDSIAYLKANEVLDPSQIIEADFLKFPLEDFFSQKLCVIGNYPYNISSQILFKVVDHRNIVDEAVGMFQKEVAERIASKPGNKVYGVISVLLQAYYDIEYLFTVHENVFNPPPKVKSAVIRLVRNKRQKLDCDEELFRKIVKTSFNTRRKMLRSSLRGFFPDKAPFEDKFFMRRPETLSIEEFIWLTNFITENR